MNEELTREVLEAIKKCNETHCNECLAVGVCCSEDDITIGQRLATALLAERAKPKVWDGAPEWVNAARVRFFVNDRNDGHSEVFSETYRRELPKTRARIIAEEEGQGLAKKNGWSVAAGALVANVVEAALNKYAEELTNTKETN